MRLRSWIKQYVPYWHRQSEYLLWPGLLATDATMYAVDAEFYKNDLPLRNAPRLTSNVSREKWNWRTDRWDTQNNVITLFCPGASQINETTWKIKRGIIARTSVLVPYAKWRILSKISWESCIQWKQKMPKAHWMRRARFIMQLFMRV